MVSFCLVSRVFAKINEFCYFLTVLVLDFVKKHRVRPHVGVNFCVEVIRS